MYTLKIATIKISICSRHLPSSLLSILLPLVIPGADLEVKNPRLEISARFTHDIAADCSPLRNTFLYLILALHIKITWRKYKKTFYFNMKISQKSVSLRCRVLVKNKRLVVFRLLIEMHVLVAGVKAEDALLSSACQCLQTVSHMHPPPPCSRGWDASLSSSESGSDVGDRHLPLPMACGTHVLHESGYLPNKTHSNTADK